MLDIFKIGGLSLISVIWRSDLGQTFPLSCLVYIYTKTPPCNVTSSSLALLISVEQRQTIFFCAVLFCELYPGEGLQMRRLDGFGLFSFSPQPAADWARCCSNRLWRSDLHMDFPFLVGLLVTLLLANRTNNARLLLFVVPVAQHLPPNGTYYITLYSTKTCKVFDRYVWSTCTYTFNKGWIILKRF